MSGPLGDLSQVRKLAMQVPIARELLDDLRAQAIDLRPISMLTPDERRDREQARQEFERVRSAALAAALEAHGGLLADIADSTLREVASLHGPAEDGLVCIGCDAEGYETEWPTWPCRTYELIAKAHRRGFDHSGRYAAMVRNADATGEQEPVNPPADR